MRFEIDEHVRHSNGMRGIVKAQIPELAGIVMTINNKACEYPSGPGYLVKLAKGTHKYNSVIVSESYLTHIADRSIETPRLSDDDVEAIAQRVAEIVGTK